VQCGKNIILNGDDDRIPECTIYLKLSGFKNFFSLGIIPKRQKAG
jgi:hypothetical protein